MWDSPDSEGFVVQVETVTDELGLVEAQRPVTGKRRRPRVKAGSKYKFVPAVKKTQKYKGYFDPDRDIKMRLARLGDLVCLTEPLSRFFEPGAWHFL